MRRFIIKGEVRVVKDNQLTEDEKTVFLSEQNNVINAALSGLDEYKDKLSFLLAKYEKRQLDLSKLSADDDAYDEAVKSNEAAKLAYTSYIDTSYETAFNNAVFLYKKIDRKKPAAPAGAVELTGEQLEKHLSDDYEFDTNSSEFIEKVTSDDELAEIARAKRDQMIGDISYRYERYASETRLNLKTTDSIKSLDEYVQALRDITKQKGFPVSILWPIYS